jgi:hypothetical protein
MRGLLPRHAAIWLVGIFLLSDCMHAQEHGALVEQAGQEDAGLDEPDQETEVSHRVIPVPEHFEMGFSCYKVCALFAKMQNRTSMSIEEQSQCCARVRKFERTQRMTSLVSLGASSKLSALSPRAQPPVAVVVSASHKTGQTDHLYQQNLQTKKSQGTTGDLSVKVTAKSKEEPYTVPTPVQKELDKQAKKKLPLPPVPGQEYVVVDVPVTPSPTTSPSTSPAPSVNVSAPPAPPANAQVVDVPVVVTVPATTTHLESVTPANKTLLIAIETAPAHFDERMAIRETWMKYVKGDNRLMTKFRREQTDIMFFIGNLNPVPKTNSTDELDPSMLSKMIMDEQAKYGDIVRLTDFVEDYSNLTLKTLSVMTYASQRRYDAMFKTDDDSFVRVNELWSALGSVRELKTSYISHCSFDFPVNQDPESKNYMYDTFPYETIPILCHGGGYLVGLTLLDYLVNNRNNLPMHRNEDVAVSLWLTGQDSRAPKLYLDPNLPVTFFWEECNPASVYLNPMRVDDMHTAWTNVQGTPPDVCANNFQLREFLDLLDQLQKEQEEQHSPY